MERYFVFDQYNTWTDWGLILTAKTDVTPPEVKTNYVDIAGMSGSLDLSDVLSGEPTFEMRTFSASFCACDTSYEARKSLMTSIISAIHGRKLKIMEPDDTGHYFLGRVMVKNVNHTISHTEFTVDCICEPWRYEMKEAVQVIPVNSRNPVNVRVHNSGRKTICPDITVSGQVTFTCQGVTSQATDGKYKITTFKLYQGENVIQVSGSGTLTLTYRRADL